MNKSKFGLHFGALCPDVKQQLNDQGIYIPEKSTERYQKIADAITMCLLNHVIPDSVAQKARGKLIEIIAREVNKPKWV